MVVLQGSLFTAGAEVAARPSADGWRRQLGGGAWVELRRSWVQGADGLFERLLGVVPWQAERRRMYDRMVDVPRLHAFYGEGQALPDPGLAVLRRALDDDYGPELGEPFRTAGLCLYRHGADSVAWHGDTIGRGARHDTMVAVVSLGSPRAFLLRPRGGGRAVRLAPAAGDLLVMGGSCQRTWEHAVPKTRRPVGPRLSVQFRPRDVR